MYWFKTNYVYVPLCGLFDIHKSSFYDSFINGVRKIVKTVIVVIAQDFNGHVGSNAEGTEDQRGDYGYGVRDKDGENFMKFIVL